MSTEGYVEREQPLFERSSYCVGDLVAQVQVPLRTERGWKRLEHLAGLVEGRRAAVGRGEEVADAVLRDLEIGSDDDDDPYDGGCGGNSTDALVHTVGQWLAREQRLLEVGSGRPLVRAAVVLLDTPADSDTGSGCGRRSRKRVWSRSGSLISGKAGEV